MTSSTSVHSNAFNFMSYLQGGVDPRTGQYTVSINLPDVKTNDLQGPGVPLTLTYNPLNKRDSGFGLGWNLQLSQYTPTSQIISLSSGETFKCTSKDGKNQWLMSEKKLDSFHFYEESATRYRIVHKSGLVEYLELQGDTALPVEIHSPEGHKVTLHYDRFNDTDHMLVGIVDGSGNLLTVSRDPSSIKIELMPDAEGGPLAQFVMKLSHSDDRVSEIVLPTENQASWRFLYDLFFEHLCMISVETPTGGREEIVYGDTGHRLPTGSGRPNLPRVTDHHIFPGFEQPMIDVRYTYPGDDEHNFLGGGEAISWADDGLDNLYKYGGTYDYSTVETYYVGEDGNQKEARSIKRTFNKFHLLTEQATTQNGHVHTQATTYHMTPGASFDAQPSYFQLPKTVETIWAQGARRRSETVSTTYDNFGNLLSTIQATGVVETTTWFPAAGGDGCPPDPEGFVRYMKDHTVTPATSSAGSAPTLSTRYRYTSMPVLGSPVDKWVTVDSETLVQLAGSTANELQTTKYEYVSLQDEPYKYGRVSKQTVTLNGKDTVIDYAYEKIDGGGIKESVLQTVETVTGFDHLADGRNVQKQITLMHSLLNDLPLLTRDDNDVEIRYVYDNLRRVISETVAPGTDFEAARRYEYTLCATAGQQAEQRLFDVKNVQTTTQFDGLNRAIYEARDDADNALSPKAQLQTYEATYDSLGNLVEETEYDWRPGTTPLALKTEITYDDWGAQRCVTGPDGVSIFEETDPIGSVESAGPIQTSWREGTLPTAKKSGKTVTWLNLFGKPTQTTREDWADQAKVISLHRYFYDGLGRTAKEIVGLLGQDDQKRETLYKYDAFDRMVETTLPLGAVVNRSYASHSSEDLPTAISVLDKDTTKPLGIQAFDGLDRMIESTTGGRKQVLSYDPGQTEPSMVTTPGGEQIEYRYEPKLSSEPKQRILPDSLVADYQYDPKNARLTRCSEQGIQIEREYFSTGDLKSETQTLDDVPRSMYYTYSRLGRLLGYQDVLENTQSYEHNDKGQLIFTKLGTTLATFSYDALGQTVEIKTIDGQQSVTTTLEYDEFGREILRTFDLNGTQQRMEQVYNDVDNLTQRTLTQGAATLRDETYAYDLRGRLIRYECTGTESPVDPYGNAITRQTFTFDGLDNMNFVITAFEGGSNRAQYSYAETDPAQLVKVTNTNPAAGYPAEINLAYNDDGHMIVDEEQRTLDYDAKGRLISVSDGGTTGSYGYGPLDTLSQVVNDDGQEQRFYQNGNKLVTRRNGDQSSSFMHADGNVLAERQGGAGPKSLLLTTDNKQTVISELGGGTLVHAGYSAYGDQPADPAPTTRLRFNGELVERVAGWYLLGNGYRAYNPGLMRFHSPDSLSPFGEGGINAYMYCGGDPVNFGDPTGHTPWFNLFRGWPAEFRLPRAKLVKQAPVSKPQPVQKVSWKKPIDKTARIAEPKKSDLQAMRQVEESYAFLTSYETGPAPKPVKSPQPQLLKKTRKAPAPPPPQGKPARNLLTDPKSGWERFRERTERPLTNAESPLQLRMNLSNKVPGSSLWSQARQARLKEDLNSIRR